MPMTWNYVTIGHGKGEVDGVRALLKQELNKKKMKPYGMKKQNVHEVVTYLKAKSNKYHASHLVARKMVHKCFWQVKVDDIDRATTFDCSCKEAKKLIK
jgi:ABC-type transporter MlaC component